MAVMVGYIAIMSSIDCVSFSMFHYNFTPNSPELSLLKFLLLAYHHSHSWPLTWISHLFSQWPSWGPYIFFTAWLFLDYAAKLAYYH